MSIIITCIITLGLLARYVPGPKCVTYCLYKTKKAQKTLKSITSYGKLNILVINNLTTKELVTLLKTLEFNGCRSFNKDIQVINDLREVIAERQLLGIK